MTAVASSNLSEVRRTMLNFVSIFVILTTSLHKHRLSYVKAPNECVLEAVARMSEGFLEDFYAC